MHSAVEAGNAATTCFPLHNEAPPSEGRGAIGRLEFRFAQVSSVTAFQSRNWLKILSERFIVDCLLEQEFTSVWALEVEKKKKEKKGTCVITAVSSQQTRASLINWKLILGIHKVLCSRRRKRSWNAINAIQRGETTQVSYWLQGQNLSNSVEEIDHQWALILYKCWRWKFPSTSHRQALTWRKTQKNRLPATSLQGIRVVRQHALLPCPAVAYFLASRLITKHAR